MFISFYSIIFIIFLLFFLDNNINFKANAISISSDDQHNSEREQLNHYLNNNNNNNNVSLPLEDTDNNIFIKGIVDSSFSTAENNFWIATGNWSMNLKNNIPLFNLNMTWYNNKESIPRTYKIFNFEPFNTKVGSLPDNILYTNGTTNISLNNQIIPNIPITINIQKNKIMTVYYNDIIFNKHFGKEPLHGIVTSITSKDNSNFNGNFSIGDQIDQKSINLQQQQQQQQQQNNLPDNNNNNILPNNTNNTSKYNDSNIINGQQQNISIPSITTNSSSLIIPDNAGLIGNPSFSPSVIEIKAGEKISVINNDKNYHTVTSINGENKINSQIGMLFDSGIINPQKTITVDTTKLESGQYQFECSIHPFMKGTLIVE
jgi:plastocyanin